MEKKFTAVGSVGFSWVCCSLLRYTPRLLSGFHLRKPVKRGIGAQLPTTYLGMTFG